MVDNMVTTISSSASSVFSWQPSDSTSSTSRLLRGMNFVCWEVLLKPVKQDPVQVGCWRGQEGVEGGVHQWDCSQQAGDGDTLNLNRQNTNTWTKPQFLWQKHKYKSSPVRLLATSSRRNNWNLKRQNTDTREKSQFLWQNTNTKVHRWDCS